jgi:methionyl-tRNA synthetase
LNEALRLAAEVNKYLDRTAPWFTIKSDKAAAGRAVYAALRAIDSLKILFAPFLPFSCERLHTYLGYTAPLFGSQFTETIHDVLGEHTVLRYRPGSAVLQWQPSRLPAGQALIQPQPLFKKLEPSIAAEERARLGNS